MLYIVSTPIGNLEDITYRAVKQLGLCDLILCEDTRHSSPLLKKYGIHKPLKSYHQFNEKKREGEILALLKEGKEIALISDAGTPAIADPGMDLVQRCVEQEFKVVALPGASAVMTALVCSGLDTSRYQFIGFLPSKKGALRKELDKALAYEGVTVCYESPHRIRQTLEMIDPTRRCVIARELTKIYEEFLRGTAAQLLEHPSLQKPRGEMTLMIAPGKPAEKEWNKETLQQEVVKKIDEGLSPSDAIREVARSYALSKKQVYAIYHQLETDF